MRIYEFERELSRSYPGGIRPVAAPSVHAARSVEVYAILPEEAGLMQALGARTLIHRPSDGYPITPGYTRFPAGLSGVRFVLPSGLAMPLGDMSRIRVLAQDTCGCLSGRRCG